MVTRLRRSRAPTVDGVLTLPQKIRQRRAQMLIHSYLYYKLDEPIVSDHQWQEWADELVKLHDEYRGAGVGFYDTAFEDWDASTGYHLPFDGWVAQKAKYILGVHKRKVAAPVGRVRRIRPGA